MKKFLIISIIFKTLLTSNAMATCTYDAGSSKLTNFAYYSCDNSKDIFTLPAPATKGYSENYITGLGGRDVLTGSSKRDTIEGGLGDNSLSGRDGNDALISNGGGNDTLTGGLGYDAFIIYPNNGKPIPTITDLESVDTIKFARTKNNCVDKSINPYYAFTPKQSGSTFSVCQVQFRCKDVQSLAKDIYINFKIRLNNLSDDVAQTKCGNQLTSQMRLDD